VINRFMKGLFEAKRMVSKIDLVMVTHELKHKRRGLHALYRFTMFAALFFVIITLQKKPWHAFSVEKSLRDIGQAIRFGGDEYSWEDVVSVENVRSFIPNMISRFHIGDAAAAESGALGGRSGEAYLANYNHIVGGLVIRQWRYSSTPCDDVYPRATFSRYATTCQDGENFLIDYLGDQQDFGITLNQSTGAPLPFTYTADKRYGDWENGFSEIIDLGVFGGTEADALAAWAQLVANGFVDRSTKHLQFTVATFNGNLGLFATISTTFKFFRGGHIVASQVVTSIVVANKYE
jgi:hypothetical protein